MGFPTALVILLSKWTSRNQKRKYLEGNKACLALETLGLATLELSWWLCKFSFDQKVNFQTFFFPLSTKVFLHMTFLTCIYFTCSLITQCQKLRDTFPIKVSLIGSECHCQETCRHLFLCLNAHGFDYFFPGICTAEQTRAVLINIFNSNL